MLMLGWDAAEYTLQNMYTDCQPLQQCQCYTKFRVTSGHCPLMHTLHATFERTLISSSRNTFLTAQRKEEEQYGI